MDIEEAIQRADEFVERVRALEPELEVSIRPVPGVDDAAIDSFEEETGRAVSDELRALWRHGAWEGAIFRDEDTGSGRFDFQPIAAIRKQLPWWGNAEPERLELEDLLEEGEDPGTIPLRIAQLERGVPVWSGENTIVVDGETGTISRISGESAFPSLLICDDLATFIAHFVAAGAYHCGLPPEAPEFEAYMTHVRSAIPLEVPGGSNVWLQHLSEWYS